MTASGSKRREVCLDTMIQLHMLNQLRERGVLVAMTERGYIYRPWPRSGDVVAVAFERRGLEYVFDHIYGVDAHSRGVPKRQ